MEADQLLVWKSLRKALVCLLGPKFQTPRIAKRREQLDAAEKEVAALNDKMQGSGPGSSKRSDTIVAKNLRVALRTKHMNPISAEGLLYLDGMPGIEDMLRLPPTRLSDQKLVDAAKRIINNVRPYRDTFIENGWTPDFIARADGAVKALENHIRKRCARGARSSRRSPGSSRTNWPTTWGRNGRGCRTSASRSRWGGPNTLNAASAFTRRPMRQAVHCHQRRRIERAGSRWAIGVPQCDRGPAGDSCDRLSSLGSVSCPR